MVHWYAQTLLTHFNCSTRYVTPISSLSLQPQLLGSQSLGSFTFARKGRGLLDGGGGPSVICHKGTFKALAPAPSLNTPGRSVLTLDPTTISGPPKTCSHLFFWRPRPPWDLLAKGIF